MVVTRFRSLCTLALLLVAAALAVPGQAAASGDLRIGFMDDPLLDNRPDLAWPWIERLRPQVIRYNLDWPEVAPRRPKHARDPEDRAYRFGVADRVVRNATRLGIPVVLTIVHTP